MGHSQDTPALRPLVLIDRLTLKRSRLDQLLTRFVSYYSLGELDLARLAGIEPTTLGFGGRYSIH